MFVLSVVMYYLQESVTSADLSDGQKQDSCPIIVRENICSVCEEVCDVADMVLCSGGCADFFHPSCSSSHGLTVSTEHLLCPDCTAG